MKHLKNVLPKAFARDLHDEFMGPGIPWNYNPNTVMPASPLSRTSPTTQDSPQLTHVMAYDGQQCSPYYNLVYPVIYFLEQEYKIIRCKANLMLPDGSYNQAMSNTQHKDMAQPGFHSFVYYVNTNDGATRLFDDMNPDYSTASVGSVYNEGVLFDSATWHASVPPKTTTRVVINFILEPL